MIRAENLTMQYGPVTALKNVSFQVEQGEIVGLLGPNGAGKSTTMKILTTYLCPTKGTAKVGGKDVLEHPLDVRKSIGYLPEVLPLYMDMEVRTYLDFVGKARGLSGARLAERTDVVLDRVGLRPMYRKIIRELSKGYKQRTGLAQALIHDPDIVILDEPTSGLDPHQILEIRDLIRDLAKDKTVMISTHILQEIEATADRILIISQGEIAGNGSIDELRAKAQSDERLAITVKGDEQELQRLLSGINGAQKVECLGNANGFASFEVHAKLGTELWKEAGELARAKSWEIRELRDRPLGLEETFLALTAESVSHRAQEGDQQ
jgi:ABC-2 type transport system ATP-binding protein